MSKIVYEVTVNEEGDRFWHLNGKCHREDGPAIECANGTRYWFKHDKCHRLDGPAIEWANGLKEWYVENVKYTEEEFKSKINPHRKMTVPELCQALCRELGCKIKIIKE